MKDGLIYFISPLRSRRVKVGWTANLERRLLALQTGNHADLHVLLAIPGTVQMEHELHARFKKHRVQGEWFTMSDEIKAFIAENGGRLIPPAGSYSRKARADDSRIWASLDIIDRRLRAIQEKAA